MSDTANQAIDIGEAASAFEGILAREDGEQELENGQTEEAPAKAAESPPETTEEPEGEPEAEATPEGEAEQEPTQQPQRYTVKVDGETQEVTLEEALKGYQREASYTRKSMELAEARKAFQAHEQAVSQERTQYSQLLTALHAQLKGEAEPDWEKLKNEDQFQYVVQREEWRAKQEKQAAIQSELQRVGTLKQQEQQQSLQTQLAEGKQKLLDAIPAWKDSKKFETGKAEIRDYARSIGFTDEEIASTYDPRAVLALYKAAQFDKLAAGKLQPVQNRGPRTMAPGSTAQTPGRPAELTRAKQRLAQTGSVQDAADIFERFME